MKRETKWMITAGSMSATAGIAVAAYTWWRRGRADRLGYRDYLANAGQPDRPEGTEQEIDQERHAREQADKRAGQSNG